MLVKGNFYVDGALNKKKLEDFIVKDLDLSKITCLIMILRVKDLLMDMFLENDDDSSSSSDSSSSDSSSSDSSSSSTRSKYSRYRQKTLYIDENGLIKIE